MIHTGRVVLHPKQKQAAPPESAQTRLLFKLEVGKVDSGGIEAIQRHSVSNYQHTTFLARLGLAVRHICYRQGSIRHIWGRTVSRFDHNTLGHQQLVNIIFTLNPFIEAKQLRNISKKLKKIKHFTGVQKIPTTAWSYTCAEATRRTYTTPCIMSNMLSREVTLYSTATDPPLARTLGVVPVAMVFGQYAAPSREAPAAGRYG